MPPSSTHVAVVILNYKGWQDTLACVQSLLDSRMPDKVSVVVLDNASPNGSMQHLVAGLQPHQTRGIALLQLNQAQAERGEQAMPPAGQTQLVLVQNNKNWGFAGGCNPGMRWAMAAGADYVWLLNNDTEVGSGAMAALLNRFEARPEVGICGSKLIYFDSRDTLQGRGGATYEPHKANGKHLGVGDAVNSPEDVPAIEARMDYVIGASMMVSRTFIERVGLMTDDYLLYYEELDWATRGKRLGFALGYAADSHVFHKEGATIGSSHRQYNSPFSQRFLCRNRLLFTQRFYPEHLNRVRLQLLLEFAVWMVRGVPGHAFIILGALFGRPVKLPN
jgi:GT2 family glycosyltransferase